MAGRILLVLVVLVAASLLLHRTAAETYVVGNELSWQIPPNSTAYSTWASAYTFRVGDTLEFNFVTGSHDVAEVTKEAFDACNSSNPIILLTNGPANYTLNKTGENYFFCAVDGHCGRGQKLSISVASSSNESPSPPSPSSGTTPSPPPPPPSNSASSLASATFSVIFMFIAAGFL